MDAYEMILTRKSVRSYTGKPVPDELIEKILLAGTRAPSGMANEPWRFSVVRDAGVKAEIAEQTKHTAIINGADVLICLFFDTTVGYSAQKDANTMGACAQNMLLAAHALGLGAVWIAEILKNKDNVAAICGVDGSRYELSVVIPIGYSAEDPEPRPRKHSVKDVLLSTK